MTCCFFGHRDTPETIRPRLRAAIRELITNGKADHFYVGNQGRFDSMVISELRELKKEFPAIKYEVVLAYLPKRQDFMDSEHSLYPEGLESVPPQFAISKRNRWIIKNSQILIAYVKYSTGGAAKALREAEKRQLEIIYL